jgi:hypothetical protein
MASFVFPQCHALTKQRAKGEIDIPCREALDEHGISVAHGRMPTNGELRFRLNCTDGTAYIRTQTSSSDEGWQNPHYHNVLRETYIVEKGWVGYAESRNGVVEQHRYEAGSVFTTEPAVAHNIFMPRGAVIHTVKHDVAALEESKKGDWHGDSDDPRIRQLIELRGKSFVATGQVSVDFEQEYNAAYRHFDKLIWEAPAWSSGLFAVVAVSLSAEKARFVDEIASRLHISPFQVVGSLLTLFGLFIVALGYALYRFRWHQLLAKKRSRSSSSPIASPQLYLQLVVALEAWFLLLAGATLIGLDPGGAFTFLTVLLVVAESVLEQRLARREKKLHPPSAFGIVGTEEHSVGQGVS